MNKNIFKSLIKLLTIFIIFCTSIGAYAKEDISISKLPFVNVQTIDTSKIISNSAKGIEKVNESNVIHVRKNVNNNINYSIPNNSINISGVLSRSLVQDDGSYKYLNHNINGVYDGVGIPFVDFRSDFTGRKTIVYAHSSLDGSGPFQSLQNYHNNPGFYNAHRYITVNYNGQTYNYLIFSVYVSLANSEEDEGLEYYRNMNYSDFAWEYALNKYKSHSEYDTGVSVNSNDKIIILQTCSMDPNYYEKYYRYNLLIMGKLV